VQDAVDTLGLLEVDGLVARLELVGDVFPGYEAVVDDIHRRAADAGTTDRMHLHGFDTDVWPYLADADILLVPSRLEETFGNVAIEGLRAARPIVVSSTSGLLEAADGFRAAVGFPPGDTAALTNAIREIVEHWSDYRDRALADADRAADKFSLERYRNAMAAVIEKAAPDASN
jgi:glycosyltransferase involved in cell wall biosynthesis